MDSVNEVEAIADKLAEEAGLDEDTRFHVTMAVREATVNAVLHGNEYDPSKQITATFENTGSDLVFIITDQGKGLDPETLPGPPCAGEPAPRHRSRHLHHPVVYG